MITTPKGYTTLHKVLSTMVRLVVGSGIDWFVILGLESSKQIVLVLR